ncbi:hypothetical protein PENTCL1PPCAC_25840, partial [Pristionchus entomophagus]
GGGGEGEERKNIDSHHNPTRHGVSLDDALIHRSQGSLKQGIEAAMVQNGGGHNFDAKRNARERTRVHNVNKAFHALKKHLPALRIHSKRVSKLRIIKAAIIYINNLMDTVASTGESYRPNGGNNHLNFSLEGNLVRMAPAATSVPATSAFGAAPKLEWASIFSTTEVISNYSSPWTANT